jgi:hypothetical protein
MWAKEFKDLDTPSQQIKRLKEILTELGMTGRLSLEQAKAIKEKRELAQELGGLLCAIALPGNLISGRRGCPIICEICRRRTFDSGTPKNDCRGIQRF